MTPETQGWIIAALVASLGGLLTLIGKFLFDRLGEHLKAVKENTLGLALLQNELKNIMANSEKIPEMTKDLNNYYYRLKAVEAQIGIRHEPTK